MDRGGGNYYCLTRRVVVYNTEENRRTSKSPIDEIVGDDGRLYYVYEDGHTMPIATEVVNEAVTDEHGVHLVNSDETYAAQLYRYQDNLDAEIMLPADENWGSGDFRSKACEKFFDEADIIVTNPPFSLFREFVSLLMEKGKKFIVIGNMNCVTYKEIFPLIKDNKLWVGANSKGGSRKGNSLFFRVSDDSDGSSIVIKDGVKYNQVTAWWFTNVDLDKRHDKLLLLTKEENETNGVVYSKYDNYDAIEVSRTVNIPCDYEGIMGVPISFLDKYCPEQFEIVGLTSSSEECAGICYIDKFYGTRARISNKAIYARLLIRLI